MATTETDNALAPDLSDNQDWRDSLSEELRSDPTLESIKDIESAAKTLIHQQKMMGSRIPLPKTDEEREELYTKLGRPEKAEEYKLTLPEGYDSYYPTEMLNSFKDAGHKLGLTPDQMQGLVNWQKTSFDYQTKQEGLLSDTVGIETEDVLKEEFGANYVKNMQAAHRALKIFGNKALKDKLEDPRYGNDVDLIRMLANAGKDITEDSAKGTTNNSLVMSPMDAQMKIDQIDADLSHPYWDGKHPKHTEALLEREQLFEKVHGEE